MSHPYQSPVCRGSIYLQTGCGHCERCEDERHEMLRAQQAAAERSDVHVANEPDSYEAISRAEITDAKIVSLVAPKITASAVNAWKAQQDWSIEAGRIEPQGLPVAGYKKTQPPHLIALVNENKVLEEKILRQIDAHGARGTELDQRAVALARTKIQEAFMWLNRGVFQPQRIEGDL